MSVALGGIGILAETLRWNSWSSSSSASEVSGFRIRSYAAWVSCLAS